MNTDRFFMRIALEIAQQSKDPVTKVGAVIVDGGGNIVSTGYNHMPRGCEDESLFPWTKPEKHNYVIDAEANAVLNNDVRDCKIYQTLSPCNNCAKLIIQSGISEVIYLNGEKMHKDKYSAAAPMFAAAKIKFRHFADI